MPISESGDLATHRLDASTEPTGSINYFDSRAAAARYAADRPRRHSSVLNAIQSHLKPHFPVERALDVGCGTGNSTVALLPCARQIIGLDASSEMLAQAERHPTIQYVKGYAESLPFRSGHFDLVTVGSAYHWFDHERFLAEAARVLRPGGWLALYKIGSMGRRPDDPEFETWRRDVLHVRYPKVARNDEPLTAARAARFGFSELMCQSWSLQNRCTLSEYVANLMTHSRFIRAAEGGSESPASTQAWLRRELAPFFPDGEADFVDEARVHLLLRMPPPGGAPAGI